MPPIPTHMRVLQIEGPYRPEWKEIAMPEPGPGDVLVKILGVTTCPHWDLHMMEGKPMFADSPLTYPLPPGLPGHEAMGEVIVVGKDVTSFTPGMHVAAWRDPGGRSMGCYAQFVSLPAGDLIEVEKTLLPGEIASLELAMCVQSSFHRLRQLDAVEGRRLAIGGLGPSGLIAVQIARALGAEKVIGFDPLPGRRALALDLGAHEALDPAAYTWPDGRSHPQAFDSALDTTGLPVSIERLMASTRNTVALFGVLREHVRFGPDHWWGGFALLGYGTHTREAAEQAYQMITAGNLKLAPLVSRSLSFRRYSDGVELLRNKKAIKILFDPWSSG
jgi:threonine dehydrogenase-like Zn-dependent dehydrogenase